VIDIYKGRLLRVNFQKLLNGLHFITAGTVSFARGLNDTPKIAGLALLANSVGMECTHCGCGHSDRRALGIPTNCSNDVDTHNNDGS